MDPRVVKELTPSEVAGALGLDLQEAIRAVPLEHAPFRPETAPRGDTGATRRIRRVV